MVLFWDAHVGKIEALSRGMSQKAQFVAATLHEPGLIIVDEPSSGLDPVNTRIIKELLYQMRERGAAIIMSTHKDGDRLLRPGRPDPEDSRARARGGLPGL